MPTWITTTEIYQQLDNMGEANLKTVVSHCGRNQWNYPAFLLAISSREAWVENILGDSGNGRGAWQIDDRYNAEYLASIIGCKPGTWDDFFDLLKTVEIPKDFMVEREDSLPQERDIFND